MFIDVSGIMNVMKDLLIVLTVPVLRSVSAWAVKALEDNRVTRFEYRKLLQTIVRVGTIGVMGYFGLSIMGIENAAIASAIGSFFADKILNALKVQIPVRR